MTVRLPNVAGAGAVAPANRPPQAIIADPALLANIVCRNTYSHRQQP
jgi:hypothetical protein